MCSRTAASMVSKKLPEEHYNNINIRTDTICEEADRRAKYNNILVLIPAFLEGSVSIIRLETGWLSSISESEPIAFKSMSCVLWGKRNSSLIR